MFVGTFLPSAMSLAAQHCRIEPYLDQGGAAARRRWRARAGLCVGTPARHGRAAAGGQPRDQPRPFKHQWHCQAPSRRPPLPTSQKQQLPASNEDCHRQHLDCRGTNDRISDIQLKLVASSYAGD